MFLPSGVFVRFLGFFAFFAAMALSQGCFDRGGSNKTIKYEENNTALGAVLQVAGDLQGLDLGDADKIKIWAYVTDPADSTTPGAKSARAGGPEKSRVHQHLGGFDNNGDDRDESVTNVIVFQHPVDFATDKAGNPIVDPDKYVWHLEIESVEGYQCTLSPSSDTFGNIGGYGSRSDYTITTSCKHPYPAAGTGEVTGHTGTVKLKLADGSTASVAEDSSSFSVPTGTLTEFVTALTDEEAQKKKERAYKVFDIGTDPKTRDYWIASTPSVQYVSARARGHTVEVTEAPAGQKCAVTLPAVELLSEFKTLMDTSTQKTVGVLRQPVENSGTTKVVCEDGPAVRGTATDLDGTIVLLLNASEELTLTTGAKATTRYVFPSSGVKEGDSYAVSVKTQPAHQNCTVGSATGTVAARGVSVPVSCTYKTYSIGGSVTGHTGTVTLSHGGQTISVAQGTTSYSISGLQALSNQAVTVTSSPAGQTCTIAAAGTQSALAGNVTNANVTCTTNPVNYTVRVNVSGLTGGTLYLRNQINMNTLTVTANGLHAFSQQTAANSSHDYDVRALDPQPSGQTCTLTGAAGTASADVTVTATCAAAAPSTYTVGGSANGIQFGESVELTLTYDGGTTEDKIVTGDMMGGTVNFDFAAGLQDGDTYDVTIKTQPVSSNCSVTSGDGTIFGANVTDVAVTCN